MRIKPGLIAFMGSGETAPNAQKIYHRLFSRIEGGVRVAILETPAGFELNSDDVARQVGLYLQKQLQNFRPAIDIIPARKKGTTESPDNPSLAARLYDDNIVFMGPGSPTYLIRQLSGSLSWHTMKAIHRLGAMLIFASAGTLAMGSHTLPVYEIYKVGEDLHWKRGLDFFGDWGLSIIFVSHWNNSDGGTGLDTSRCYLGRSRFEVLMDMLPPDPARRIVGIDENTSLIIDPEKALCSVLGIGGVTVIYIDKASYFVNGESFPLTLLGDFRIPADGDGIPQNVWTDTLLGIEKAAAARQAKPRPDSAVLALVDERNEARQRKDWRRADDIRDQIAKRGWHVNDSLEGALLEPLDKGINH